MLSIAYLLYSLVPVAAKIAAGQSTMLMVALYMGWEIALLGIYALLWQQILKKIPLIVAMSYKGITVVLGLLWSTLFFSEEITAMNLLGTAFIIVGIWMIALDE